MIFHHSILLFLVIPDKIGLGNNYFTTLSPIPPSPVCRSVENYYFSTLLPMWILATVWKSNERLFVYKCEFRSLNMCSRINHMFNLLGSCFSSLFTIKKMLFITNSSPLTSLTLRFYMNYIKIKSLSLPRGR